MHPNAAREELGEGTVGIHHTAAAHSQSLHRWIGERCGRQISKAKSTFQQASSHDEMRTELCLVFGRGSALGGLGHGHDWHGVGGQTDLDMLDGRVTNLGVRHYGGIGSAMNKMADRVGFERGVGHHPALKEIFGQEVRGDGMVVTLQMRVEQGETPLIGA